MNITSALEIRVSECFLSLQGEGPSLGRPAHFLRLQGCSVGCHWCDSKYTWRPDAGDSTSIVAVEGDLRRLGDAELLVITGGEPLECADLPDLLAWSAQRWTRVEVETSGLLAPPETPDNVYWNWSPKLTSVTPSADQTWSHAASFCDSERYICKVVVDSTADWEDACDRIQEMSVPAERVYVMPQGMNAEALHATARWLAPLCISRGFRLTPRMHVDLWGARRGV